MRNIKVKIGGQFARVRARTIAGMQAVFYLATAAVLRIGGELTSHPVGEKNKR